MFNDVYIDANKPYIYIPTFHFDDFKTNLSQNKSLSDCNDDGCYFNTICSEVTFGELYNLTFNIEGDYREDNFINITIYREDLLVNSTMFYSKIGKLDPSISDDK